MSLRLMMVAGCVLALVAPARALAQNAGDDVSTAKIHVGPLGLTPRIAIRNMGMDTNVFKSVEAPKKDFTATIEPELDSWLRLGPAQFSGKSSVQWLYFGRAADERSVGRSQAGTAELRLTHVTPSAGITYARTEKSASLEINARVPQTTLTRRAGASTNLTTALSVDIDGQWTAFQLGHTGGTSGALADSLDRHATRASASFRYVATPLTTVVVKTTVEQDRFDVTPLRNSNSTSVMPGFEFKPFALASGTLFVGYRRFNALDPQVPDYTGPAAAVSLSYVAREMTRITVGVRRDIEYSFEATQPYYVATGTDVTVKQMLGPGWDILGRVGRNRLDYRNLVGVTADAGRRDRMSSWAIGMGRYLPSGVRVGIDIEHSRRLSVVDGRGFHGFRFGGSVTYGS
jgi:hypothetical protein